jgi:hypothetical protein
MDQLPHLASVPDVLPLEAVLMTLTLRLGAAHLRVLLRILDYVLERDGRDAERICGGHDELVLARDVKAKVERALLRQHGQYLDPK